MFKEDQSLSLGGSAHKLISGINGRTHSKSRQLKIGSLGAVLRLVFKAHNVSQLPRLLCEGLGPALRLAIQAGNTAQIARLLNSGTPISFISSFPRSGNTWVRHLLSDFFLQCEGINTTTKLPIHKVVPDFYCEWIVRQAVKTSGVLVKTHDSFNQFWERYCGKAAWNGAGCLPLRRCKHVYLYRAPEDALVSFYHFHHCQKHLKTKVAAGVDAFCQMQLPAWEYNLTSYLLAAEHGIPVLFIPYELLLKHPADTLGAILRWLGAGEDRAMIERAVSNTQFNKLQSVEGQKFMRRGCAGSGLAELRPSTLREIHGRTSHLIEQANQRVAASVSKRQKWTSCVTRL